MTTLVLIPGMMCDAELWEHQVHALADVADIHIADTMQDNSIAAMAERIWQTTPAGACVCGLSMGGIVALEMWRQQPARIGGLALLNTLARADTPERAQLRRNMMALVAPGAGVFGISQTLAASFLHANNMQNMALAGRIVAMVTRVGPQVFLQQNQALLARQDLRDCIADIECPTLLVGGEMDTLTPPEMQQEIHQNLARSRLYILPDCGHLSTFEQPGMVSAYMRAWLEACATDADSW